MTLEISCAMCGKPRDVVIDLTKVTVATTVAEIILSRPGWVVQQNGPNFDIYCSEVCAK